MSQPTTSADETTRRRAGDRPLNVGCLWERTAAPGPKTSPLLEETAADVAVIGGGYTGLSCALHLAQAGTDVVLLEGEDIGFGGSGRNVGLVNAGLWIPPDDIEGKLGTEAGSHLIAALGAAPDLVFSLIDEHRIECDAVRNGTLHLGHSAAGVRDLQRRCDQWARRGAPVSLVDRRRTAAMTGTEIYHGALLDKRAGTIQPLGYARGLAWAAERAGARLYTRTEAAELRPVSGRWQVSTAKGTVTAETVVLATNAYSGPVVPLLPRLFIPVHFFQFASTPLSDTLRKTILPGLQGAWDTRKMMVSIRLDADGRLLLGSIGNLTGMGRRLRLDWASRMARRLFPGGQDIEWAFGWAGRIAFTPDHLPRIHKLASGLLTCIGYNGRGIGPGTVFGKAIAEHLLGKGESELPVQISEPETVSLRRARETVLETATRIYQRFGIFARLGL